MRDDVLSTMERIIGNYTGDLTLNLSRDMTMNTPMKIRKMTKDRTSIYGFFQSGSTSPLGSPLAAQYEHCIIISALLYSVHVSSRSLNVPL